MNAGKTHPFGWLFIYMPFSDSLSTVLSLFHHPHSLCIVLVLFSFLFLFSPMAIYTSFSSCVSLPHPSHLSLNAHSLQLPASFLFPPELCGQLFPHCRWCDLDVGRSGGSAEAWADAGTIQQTHLYHSIPPTCMKNIAGQKPGAGRQLWHTVAFVAACINLVIYCSELQKHKSHPTGVNSGERSACSHRPCRTPWRSAPSCCLYRSIANLFQSLVNALLIPPKQFHLPNHFLCSCSSGSRGRFAAALTMINRCRRSEPRTTSRPRCCLVVWHGGAWPESAGSAGDGAPRAFGRHDGVGSGQLCVSRGERVPKDGRCGAVLQESGARKQSRALRDPGSPAATTSLCTAFKPPSAVPRFPSHHRAFPSVSPRTGFSSGGAPCRPTAPCRPRPRCGAARPTSAPRHCEGRPGPAEGSARAPRRGGASWLGATRLRGRGQAPCRERPGRRLQSAPRFAARRRAPPSAAAAAGGWRALGTASCLKSF